MLLSLNLCINLIVMLSLSSDSFLTSTYKTERPPLNQFLNYGLKKYKPNRLGLRNEIVKSKVTVLGDILKKHVAKLRKVSGQNVELVFLVDASASVGVENFISELKFVKKLLADFVVSYNHTRVAVITFSSSSKVIRHIDHVAHASQKNHKCSLLERELPKIRYSGGGTYTLGALLEAQGVLAISRGDAVKAVFLVTDGYSNGGDPRPAAQFLKDKGVIIFTFGIKNGNIKELHDMASYPKEEHSYILDSFKEFEALARRALHQDLQDDVMVDQHEQECNSLCKRGFGCCDKNAYCTCGAHTGLYACTCRKGYYGTGLRKDCRRCPIGTYRDVEGPGDMTTCNPCPDKYMTSNEGSTSLFHCFCRRGFTQTGLECIKKKCSAIDPPDNGYFVRDYCENVVNAACGIRCKSGYELIGSSIRLCNDNGNWSGTGAKCVMKTCLALAAPRRGLITCSSDNQTIDTTCYFTCKPGYRLVGSKSRTCLPVAMWDGIKAYCKPITCRAHLEIKNLVISPSACAAKKVKYGTVCHLTCKLGYTLKGQQQTSCNAHGTWSGAERQRCIDIDPPVIKCPSHVYAVTEKNENFAEVNWSPPVTKDSSGERVVLSTKPVVSRPMKFKIGSHLITYQARDKWGNKANCSFTVTIEDKEPPKIDWCESPPIFLSKSNEVDVYWEEPIFSDNSGQVFIDRSKEPGKFQQGETIVEYWAIDNSGNKAVCNLTIKVKPHACELPVNPKNGVTNCTENSDSVVCTLSCQDGYAFAMSPNQDYFCSYDGVWLPDDNPMPFPECSETSISNTLTHAGEMAIIDNDANTEGTSICNSIFLMSQLENKLEQKLEDALDEMCSEDIYCNVALVEAICESILLDAEEQDNNLNYRRKKRSYKRGYEIQSLWADPTPDYRYWIRGFPIDSTFIPEMMESTAAKKRVKRQFGFPSKLFSEERNLTTSEENKDGKANFVGVLTTLILKSLGNDIGMTRLSKFLLNLNSTGKPINGMNEFIVAFANSFGKDKANIIRIIAQQHMGKKGLEDTFTISSKLQDDELKPNTDIPSSTERLAELYPEAGLLLDVKMMEISGIQADESASFINSFKANHISKAKSLKVKFKVQGHGSESGERLRKAMDGLLPFAEKGHFDVDFEEKQLKVAGIRLSEDPEYSCDPGSVLRDKSCVQCSIGTFFNVITRTCQSCPSGSFQPQEGQVSCLVCPDNTSTKLNQAKTSQDCKAMCLPGSFSSDTLEPCITCPLGDFQDEYASVSCNSCSNGTTTWRRGSWVMEECKAPCPPGHVSETGLIPCLQCPIGSFQYAESHTFCYSCPNDSLTNTSGSNSINSCNGISAGKQLALSQLKMIEINNCFSSPCSNHGKCTALNFGYICHCLPGYTGQQCENEIDECLNEPCLNSGTCTDKMADFDCKCKKGFEGNLCDIDIDECEISPCMNNGSCIDLVNSFNCICDSGYTGDVCDVNVDECKSVPCENGATCLDGISDFTCICLPGYTGRACENDIDECDSSPCLHGTCIDKVDGFSCICHAGFEGPICEADTNDCKNGTCLNGALCHDLLNGFRCQCKPGYEGKLCDKELSTDFIMEFTNPGVMDYAKLDNLPIELHEVSVCFWMRTFDSNNYGTPFSYATKQYDNTLTLTDYNGFVFYVNGQKEITDVSANDGEWHIICCTWKSINGTWAIYKDSKLADSGTGLAASQNISSSGAFVVGQEQDQVGGKYSPPESFIGEITLLNVWNKVLTREKIEELFTICNRYIGNLRSWPDFQAGLMGNVKIKSFEFCRGCDTLEGPANAKIVSSGIDPNTIFKITCNIGYKLYTGDEERKCLIDGHWSGTPAQCRAVQCDVPKLLYHGLVKASTHSYGDTLFASCNKGYRLNGSFKRKCQADGKWEGEDPICEMLTCSSPNNIDNAVIISGLVSYLPTNKVTYLCMNGYQMDGPATKTCSRTGNWEGANSECQPISCGKIPQINHGNLINYTEEEGWAGNSIDIKCAYGFISKTSNALECMDDGNWKRPLPKCVLPSCQKPEKVENGKVIVRTSTTSREAFYKCEESYVISGEKLLHCKTDGEWDHPFPQCALLPCPQPPNIVNGASQIKKVWRVGETAKYICNEGYYISRKYSLKCTAGHMEAEWIGTIPSCNEIFCPRVGNIVGGVFSIHLPISKDKFMIFPIETARHKRFLQSKDYDFPTIAVDTKDSKNVLETEFPTIKDTNDYLGEISFSQSYDNYEDLFQDYDNLMDSVDSSNLDIKASSQEEISQTVGSNDSSFQSQGIRENNNVSHTVNLNNPVVISHAQTLDNPGQEAQTGDTAYYDNIPQSQNLNDHGRLSHSIGFSNSDQISQSQDVEKDDLRQLSHSGGFDDYDHVSQSQSINSPEKISQIIGFDFKDPISQSRSIGNLDELSHSNGVDVYPPIVQSQHTNNPLPVSNIAAFDEYEQATQIAGFDDFEQVSQTAGFDEYEQVPQIAGFDDYGQVSLSNSEFDDYDGLSQSHYPEYASQTIGNFDYDGSSKLPDTDDSPAGYFDKKYRYNTTINYKCAPGYTLIGSATRRCSEASNWDELEPRCYENFCGKLTPIESGYPTYYGSGQNSKVEYSCHDGFQLIGDKELVCSPSKQWIGHVPLCKQIDCGIPHEPENGTVEYISTYFGSMATYHCFEGFVFEGINDRFCDGSGYWNGSIPRCTAIICDVPPVITNGYITFEGSLYAGSPVEYLCKECYELFGAIERKCQLDGTWSLRAPTCEMVSCESFSYQLEHGKIFGTGNICGSVIEYECDPGYNLKGKKRSRCLENKRWTNALPICEPISCGLPPLIDHSTISGTSYKFLNSITYYCDQGYTLRGSDSLICDEYGKWVGDVPKCNIVSCEKPKGPSNGKVRLSGLFYKSYSKIICDPGFELDGDDHLVCQYNGLWDKEMPYCIPTLCPAALRPHNSFYNSSELYFESFSKLLYNCSTGYQTNENDTIMTCNSEGNWTGSLIDCYPVECGQPAVPENGSIIYNTSDDLSFSYEKFISYVCDKGYELMGDKNISCLYNGAWSGSAKCEKITCSQVQIPENVIQHLVPSKRHYGATLSYSCIDGYLLIGSSTMICKESGVWSSNVPQCVPIKCPEPVEVFAAIVTGNVYEFNNNLDFHCIEGYTLKGSSHLKCTSEGKWSEEFPTCDTIICNQPDSITNGKWDEYSNYDIPIKTEPIENLVKHSKLTKMAQILENQSEGLIFRLDQQIVYRCDDGYLATSAAESTCTENGWNPPPPTCEATKCSTPKDIMNGIVIWRNITYDSNIIYKCNEGYLIKGESERRCQLNGIWSGITPYCDLVLCEKPDYLLYGTVTGDNFQYGSALSFKCDSGFDLTGSGTRVCQSNGVWSGEEPTCIEIFCGHPGNIAHADLDFSGFTVGNVANYNCKKGYKMKGRSTLNCVTSGEWDYKKPECIIINCRQPKMPKHGEALGELTTYNSKIHFSCELGFKLDGAQVISCLESGHWSDTTPTCNRVVCIPPYTPSHLVIMNDHYDYYAFDTIRYQCDDGWYAEGEMEIACTIEGIWSDHPPSCRKIACGIPPLPQDALFTGQDFLYGGTIEYHCSEGYFLKGGNRLSCNNKGMWEGDLPTCEAIDCGEPFDVPHSVMDIEAYTHGHQYKYGSITLYRCKRGYQLEGPSRIMCDQNGMWRTTGRLPECKEMRCQNLPKLRHAKAHPAAQMGRQLVMLSCYSGYLPVGEQYTSCHLGKWKIANFTCSPVECKRPPHLQNATILGDTYTYGDTVEYSCAKGYKMQGNPRLECGSDSLWLGSIPKCILLDCGPPEKLQYGNITYSSTNFLSTAGYICEKGYELKGNSSRVCTNAGKWDGHVPNCQKISCSEPKPPKDGYIVGTQYSFGESVRFVCKKGHALRGNNSTVCSDEGKWIGATPTCEVVICQPPNEIPNVDENVAIIQPHHYETKIEYGCQYGFIPRGDMSSECLEDATWSLVQGRCTKIACGRPILKENDAQLVGRSYYYKDNVRFVCPPGSRLNGSSTATCLPTGTWSSTSSCVPGCRRSCNNGGVCVGRNICSCPSGFSGDNCQKALCLTSCLNGGTCVGPFRCRCTSQFKGHRCVKPICEEGCGRHGRCIRPNLCLCRFGKTASSCDDNRRGSYQETHFRDWDIAAIRRSRLRF